MTGRIKTEGNRDALRRSMVFLSFVLLLIAAAVWNIRSGSVNISLRETLEILSGHGDSESTAYNVIWKIRLPRIMLSAILGGALSLSGFLIQTFFRNPVAGPFVLGISSGAKMFLAIATIAVSGLFADMPVSAAVAASFAGSVMSMLVVILFTGKVRSMSSLLVIGMMISYICSAMTDLLINFANDSDIVNLTHWSMGSFSAASWQSVRISALIIIPAFFAVLAFSKQMEAYSLGEGYAGSYIHGIFDENGIAEAIARALYKERGLEFSEDNTFDIHAYKETQYDKLAETVREALDMDLIYRILEEGV